MIPADPNNPGGTPPPATPPPTPEDSADTTFNLLYAAANEPAAKPDESTPADAPAGNSLLGAIADTTLPPPDADEQKKADEAKKKTDDAAAAAAAAATPPKKVRVRSKEPAPTPLPPPPAPPVAAPPPVKSDDEKLEEGLVDEEKHQLAVARFAERDNPEKYKGYPGKVTKFLKEHQSYLDKNPQATEPGTDAEEKYKAWLAKNSVNLPAHESRRLEVRMEADAIAEQRLKANDAQFGELHDDLFRRDAEPKIKHEADEFFRSHANEALPPEFTKLAKEKGIEEAKKLFPTEYRVAQEVLLQTASDVEEYRRITTANPKTGRNLKAFDPGNEQHQRLLTFVKTQCNLFKNGSPDEKPEHRSNRLRMQVLDGKSFLTRDEFYTLKPEQRGPYWTFTHDQIVAMAGIAARQDITARVTNEYKRRESEGWVRKPAAAAPTEPPPAPGSPPAPRPSPMPSGGGGAPTDDKPDRAFDLMYGT